jgi:hypothetical protein
LSVNKQYLGYAGIAIVLSFVSCSLFGINWGWVDDILRGHVVFGTFSKANYYLQEFRDMPLEAQISMYPQRWFPNVNIHGLGFILFSLIAGFAMWMSAFKRGQIFRNTILGAIILLLVSSTLHELTITRVTFMMLFAGTMLFYRWRGKLSLLLSISLILMAVIQRMEIVFYAFPMMLTVVFWAKSAKGHVSWKQSVQLALWFTMCIAISFVLRNVFEKTYYSEHRSSSVKIHYMLDAQEGLAFQNPQLFAGMTEVEKVKLLGLSTWFFQDEKVYTSTYLENVYVVFKENGLSFANSLKVEIGKAKYRYEFRLWKNWFWAFVLLSSAWLFWMLKLVWSKEVNPMIALLTGLTPLVFFCLVAGLFKLEDRVVLPLYLAYILFFVFLGPRFKKSSYIWFLLLFTPFFIERTYHMYQDKLDLNKERVLKQDFIEELKEFDADIFVYDLWTMTLIHDKPWDIVNLDKEKQVHVAYGEAWLNTLSGHKAYLTDLTGENTFESFVNYLLENEKDVVLVLSSYRAEFLQSYLTKVYDYDMVISPIEGDFAIENCNYSFTWSATEFNYYRIILNE